MRQGDHREWKLVWVRERACVRIRKKIREGGGGGGREFDLLPSVRMELPELHFCHFVSFPLRFFSPPFFY